MNSKKRSGKPDISMILMFVALVALMAGGYVVAKKKARLREAASLPFYKIEMAQVADGIYEAQTQTSFLHLKLSVTVQNHQLKTIDVLENEGIDGETARPIINRMVEQNAVVVPAVKGAELGSLVYISCVSSALNGGLMSTASEQTKQPVQSEPFTVANPYKIDESDYQTMIEKTIVSTGNNSRIKKVLAKIRNGENVKVAVIGGSVTEGAGPEKFTDGYAYQFFRALKAQYAPGDGSNVSFNNAGLSGSGSLMGIVRYEQDVVDVCGGLPDLLLVEFAVNDNGDVLCQRSFEAIIRKAMLANPDCAVIALYCVATYGNTSAQKIPVATHYAIPQINMLEVVNKAIAENVFTKEQYLTDYAHPTFEGHQFMCDCLMTLLDKIDNAEKDSEQHVPASCFKEPSLYGMKRILPGNKDANVKIEAGDFKDKDSKCQTLKKTNASDFPENWKKKMDAKSENVPFKMELTCKSLAFVYKVQAASDAEKFGQAEVYVDGRKVATYDGGKEGGWNNCEPNMIIDERKAEKHTVLVKMAPGSEKLGFTIVALGYTI